MRIGRLRWWHALLLAGLAAAGIVAAASWVILLVYGPSLTRERVEAMLSGALGEPTRVGAVHLQPWRGRVSLVDLEVPASPAPSSTRARAAAIDVSVDIASLWRREVTISVLATGLDLDATVPQGKAGGPGLLPLPEHFQVGPVRVGIGSVRIRRSRAVVRDPDAWSIEAAGADLTARPVAGDLDISGRLDALRVEALGHREQIDQVAVDGRLSADLLGVRAIAWLWQGEAMRLDGEVRHPWDAGRELSLRAEGAVALAAVARAADIDQKIEGRAQIAAGVTGPAAAPRIEARIRVPQLDVAGIAVREMSVDGRWVDRALRIDDIQARLGTGRLRGRLEATPIPAGGARISLDLGEVVLPGSLTDLGAGTASAEGRLRAGGIDVTRAQARWRGVSASLDGRIAADPSLAVRARLGVELPEISRSIGAASLGGRADISAELTRRGQAPQLEGRVGVADLVYAGHSVEPVEVSFRMAASSGQDGRWEGALRSSRIRWDQLTVDDISASLALDAQRIELIGGRARAAAIPVEVSGQWEWAGAGRGRAALGPVSLAAVPGVPAELRLGGTGRAIVDASFERGVASATALAKLDRVSAAGLALGAGDADVRLRDRALEGKLSFPSRRLTAKAAGRLESGGALTGSVEVDDLALSPLLRELGSDDAADHVAGRLSARGELSIPLEQPAGGRGAVRLTARDLVILGEPWASQGPIVLRWEAAHLIVEHFRLDGPLGSLSATGSLGGGPEDRGLSLSLANARLPGALAPLGEGAVRAEMRLAGGGVELARLDARWPGLAAAATGHAGAGGAMAFSGRADGELARLGPALGVPGIGGRATLTADGRA
ncbi:MAG TPA: hypothetical protein VEL75_16920, partial [Candidatus Methylomirabilis sp.]|nr:hypothetical protein [Candidatus Methylomirabilis sp.]